MAEILQSGTFVLVPVRTVILTETPKADKDGNRFYVDIVDERGKWLECWFYGQILTDALTVFDNLTN